MTGGPLPRLVLAAVLAGGFSASCRGADDESAIPNDLHTLFGEHPQNVRTVEVAANGAIVRLDRSGGRWRAAADGSRTSARLLDESESALLPLRAYRRLTVQATADELGLTDPQYDVAVTTEDGTRREISVGGPNFLGAGFYTRRPGDPHVYLVSRGTVDVLRSLVGGERYVSPRPARENEVLKRFADDSKEVLNPWLEQAIEEDP